MHPLSPLLRTLSPSGPAGQLSIFYFHRVLARPDALLPDEPDAAFFERLVRFITSAYRVLPLADAAAALTQGRLPSAAACITFDDGYADNLTVAAPILARHGATATVFVATGFSDGGRMWNDTVIEAVRALPAGEHDWSDFELGTHTVADAAQRSEVVRVVLKRMRYFESARRVAIADEMARRAGLPAVADTMMSRTQLLAWRAMGMDIGGHCVHHPILARLDEAQARAEIEQGRDHLTQWLGVAPRAFAYPNGFPGRDWGPREAALVRAAGFSCAVATAYGTATRHADPYGLPRIMPWGRSTWALGLRSAGALYNARRAKREGLTTITKGVSA
jgi:peptidoglycan/xylan/chitin deacetylase (PgdA/CDA1 family)